MTHAQDALIAALTADAAALADHDLPL